MMLPSTPALVMLDKPTHGLAVWTGSRLGIPPGFDDGPKSLDALLAIPLAQAREALDALLRADFTEVDLQRVSIAAPAASQEVWAAGVTYYRSREARELEAVDKDVYTRVYSADRPELFFKCAGWRVVPDHGLIGVRSDSTWNVPEPELAVLTNSSAEVFGYACGNDMSSRSIEGENPLYLPQAKIYQDSCSIGPAIALAWYVDPRDAKIRLTIQRDGASAFEGIAAVTDMVRDPGQLAAVLHSVYPLPVGAWLLTGTSIVPPAPYSALTGDVVHVAVDGLGELVNTVHLIQHSGAEALPVIRMDRTALPDANARNSREMPH